MNSSNTEIFHEASKPYNIALKQNGYKQVLVYSKNENVQDRRRKTTRKSAQENMSPLKNIQNDKIKESSGKEEEEKEKLLGPTLLCMCFPPENKFYKINNKNTIKSYLIVV